MRQRRVTLAYAKRADRTALGAPGARLAATLDERGIMRSGSLRLIVALPLILAACYGASGSQPSPSASEVATPTPTAIVTPAATPGRDGVTVLDLHVATRSCPDTERQAAFGLANGPAFWTAFPAALKAPELDGTTTPLIAIAYATGWLGPVTVGLRSGPQATLAPGHHDVCVETADGSDGTGGIGGFDGSVGQSVIFYGDIDGTGSMIQEP
jgi:hypothetical protein